MAELLAKQGYNVDDPTSVPGIFAHAAPVLSFTPPPGSTAGNGPAPTSSSSSSKRSAAAAAASSSVPNDGKTPRVFIDECNDDLVVIRGGSVTFARPSLLDDSSLSSKAVAATRQVQPSLNPASPRRSLFGGASSIRDFNMASSITANDLAPQASFDRGLLDTMLRTGGLGATDAEGAAVAAEDDAMLGGTLTDMQASIAFGPEPPRSPAASAVTDALHVITNKPRILAAKRCATRTSNRQHGGVIAVQTDEHNLAIYNSFHIPTAPTGNTTAGGSGTTGRQQGTGSRTTDTRRGADPAATGSSGPSSPAAAQPTSVQEPLATYECRPKTLRFGNNAYAIRDFYWLPAPIAWASGGTKLRAPSTTQTLLVVTEITIEILQVFPFANRAEHAISLQQRITTKSDFCAFDRFSRVLVSVNASKPNIVKPYVVNSRLAPPSSRHAASGSANGISGAAVSEDHRTEEEEVNVASSSGVDPPQATAAPSAVIAAGPTAASNATFTVLALPQIKLSDGDQVIVTDASLRQRVMNPPPLSLSIRPVTLYDRLFISVHAARQELLLFELQGYKPNDLSDARFSKVAALCLQESQGTYAIQVVDNLIVAHCLDNGLSFAFDIHVDETTDPQHATASSAAFPRGRLQSSLGAYASPGTMPPDGGQDHHHGMNATPGRGAAGSPGPSSVPGSPAGAATATGAHQGTLLARLSAPVTGKDAKVALHVPVVVTQLSAFASPLGAVLMARDARLKASNSPLVSADAGLDAGRPSNLDADVAEPDDPVALSLQDAEGMGKRAVFYNASAPLILDVTTGRVSLVGVNACGLSSQMQPLSTRTLRFLANRSGAGAAMAAALLIKDAIAAQEPLAFVGRMLDIVTERDHSAHSVKWHAGNVSRATITEKGGGSNATESIRTAAAASGSPEGRPSAGSASVSATSGQIRSNPVASDAQFHVRRAMPIGFRQVVGRSESVVEIIPSASNLDPADPAAAGSSSQPSRRTRRHPARDVTLTFLEAIDAEHGISLIDEYVKATRDRGTAATAEIIALQQSLCYRVPQVAMLRLVFDPLLELLRAKRDAELESDEDTPQTRFYLRYLRAVVLEYSRALTLPRAGEPPGAIHPDVQALLIDLCTMPPSPDYYSLHQLLMYRVVHDSTPVALRLLQIAAGYPPAFQAAVDMLGRLRNYNAMVEIYWRHRMPERAAKIAITHGVTGVSAAQLLELAAVLDDDAAEKEQTRKARDFMDADELADELPPEQLMLKRPAQRSVFAQVYAMLQPYLAIAREGSPVDDDGVTVTTAAQHHADPNGARLRAASGATVASGGGTARARPSGARKPSASPSSPRGRGSSPPGQLSDPGRVVFAITADQFAVHSERYAALVQRAASISR